jgi:hypothetical protein
VRDWRTDRSDQAARFTMGVTYSLSLVNYNKLLAENKQRYGERAETNMDFDSGIIETKVDGQVIETRTEGKTLNGVQGIFVVNTAKGANSRFPFQIDFRPDSSDPTRPLVQFFKKRFESAPQEWFEFNDADWTIDRCASLPDGFGVGALGKALDLHEGTACVVTWKGLQSGAMLITVARANGDPWLRPFTGRLCRNIVEAALKRFNPGEPGSPKYAACILADRPAYVSARKSLVVDVYSVDPYNRLARLDRQAASK